MIRGRLCERSGLVSFVAGVAALVGQAVAGADVASAQSCTGDCDSGLTVTVDELVKAVNIALGSASLSTCAAADRNSDGAVTVDEIVTAVGAALNGCPAITPATTPTPTATLATATPTPTAGIPNGIFWDPGSVYQHVLAPGEFASVSLSLAVNKRPETTAIVTLAGPGGASDTIPYSSTITLGGFSYAFYFSADLHVPYVAGAAYTLTSVTSIGTAAATFTAPGDITIAGDGSQVSWAYDGDSEQIAVVSPSQYDSGFSNKTSPFTIPVDAYADGPGTYRVGATVARMIDSVDGAAAGSALQVFDVRYADVVPLMVGSTHTPTRSATATATGTQTPTKTATPTITGTTLPTPVLTGQILIKSTRNGGSHIFVMDPDGTNLVQLTDGAGFDTTPQWNADKSQITFTRDGYLHIMNGDGSGVMSLRNSANQFDPTFSPDGTRIVYADYDGTKTNLFSYTLAGGQITPLTSGTVNDASPTFSPDGRHIYFTSNRDSIYGEIYRMDADGGNVTRITDNQDYEQLGEVSPDGTRLAYAARTAVGTISLGVFVANVDGSGVVQLTSTADTSDDERPLWSPDGNYIAFRAYIDNRPKVYRMQANGLAVTDLSRNDAYEVAGDWK